MQTSTVRSLRPILKSVSGFSYDTFLWGWNINPSPSPQPGGPGVAIRLVFHPKPALARLNSSGPN